MDPQGLLGGSWVVISGVISRVTIITTPSRGFVAPVTTAHEPPSTGVQLQRNFQRTLRAGGWAHSAGGMEIRDKVDSSLGFRVLVLWRILAVAKFQDPQCPSFKLAGFL